jgi:flavin reductase (DIM6/NTAB) family NADH-FMN oxidoreductase RutF
MSTIGLDPAALSHRDAGYLMNGLVVPRPIAWVSTLSADGIANLAPHSFFMAVSYAPMTVMFVSSHSSRHDPKGHKDSLRNAAATGEFVVNFVASSLLFPMNQTSAEVPPEVDEFALASLETAPSLKVKPPRVAAAKAAFECRLHRILEVGDGSVVFGEVVYAHIAEDVWAGGRIDVRALDPLARLGGSSYAKLGEVFSMRRPDAPA